LLGSARWMIRSCYSLTLRASRLCHGLAARSTFVR
jgi:hypothetical protein